MPFKPRHQHPHARQVVLLTGAASGIGLATAHQLAAHGHALILSDINEPALKRLAHELDPSHSRIIPVPSDVTNAAQRQHLIQTAHQHFHRVDTLINNAGIAIPNGYWWNDPDPLRVLRVNLEAPIELTRLVLPEMQSRNQGHIINMVSVASHVGSNGMYSASKFGLRGFSTALRRELLGTGIQVSIISPGFMRTPMTTQAQLPQANPETVAQAIIKVMQHPRPETILPNPYRFLVLLEYLAPKRLSDLVVRKTVMERWELKNQTQK